MNSPESREVLQSVIQILRETAERFHELDSEAEILLAKKDATGHTKKLRERAKLIVGLTDCLAGALKGVDREMKQRILLKVYYFATSAQEALESGGFSLGVLLTHQDSKIGEKNHLEKLIKSLESK